MDSESGDWQSAKRMNRWHGWGWDMVSLGNKAYVMGGFQDFLGDDWVLETMERYDNAALPSKCLQLTLKV